MWPDSLLTENQWSYSDRPGGSLCSRIPQDDLYKPSLRHRRCLGFMATVKTYVLYSVNLKHTLTTTNTLH